METVYITFVSDEEKRAARALDFVVRKNKHTGSTTGHERIHLRWDDAERAEVLHACPVAIQENALFQEYLSALRLLADAAVAASRTEMAGSPPPPTN